AVDRRAPGPAHSVVSTSAIFLRADFPIHVLARCNQPEAYPPATTESISDSVFATKASIEKFLKICRRHPAAIDSPSAANRASWHLIASANACGLPGGVTCPHSPTARPLSPASVTTADLPHAMACTKA